jgi:hypothetical protein
MDPPSHAPILRSPAPADTVFTLNTCGGAKAATSFWMRSTAPSKHDPPPVTTRLLNSSRLGQGVRACVCVCACVRAYVCVCVCV